MARRRFLQPGFWTNPLLSKCPPLTRLMFQVIWTHADFDGAFQWDPEALAMKGLPRDNFDAGEAMDRLEHDGFIRSYMVGGKRFGFVVHWHKHQDPHPGEKPVFPRPSDDPDFQVKVKEVKWRKPGDTAFEAPEVERGLYHWGQLAGRLQATCTEVAGRLPATDKEGKEGKEGLYQEVPVPKLGPVLPEKEKRRRKGNALEAFSPEASRIVGELRPIWRKEDPDGRPIRIDLSLWGQRLDEILKAHPEVTPDLLIEAGRNYTEGERFRYQAPQFFFGVGREGAEAAWVGYVRLLMTKRKPQEVAS